jgi:hypothetical protein
MMVFLDTLACVYKVLAISSLEEGAISREMNEGWG